MSFFKEEALEELMQHIAPQVKITFASYFERLVSTLVGPAEPGMEVFKGTVEAITIAILLEILNVYEEPVLGEDPKAYEARKEILVVVRKHIRDDYDRFQKHTQEASATVEDIDSLLHGKDPSDLGPSGLVGPDGSPL